MEAFIIGRITTPKNYFVIKSIGLPNLQKENDGYVTWQQFQSINQAKNGLKKLHKELQKKNTDVAFNEDCILFQTIVISICKGDFITH